MSLSINRLKPLALILAFFLVLGTVQGGTPPISKDANVLLITIDTLRWDRVGILSDKYVKTPHLDDLARRSVNFTRAFAHNPLTRPSHANIMTGTTPLYHGVSDNPGFRLEDRYLTLAEYLRKRDYRTAAFIGAFVLNSQFGLNRGFELYDDIEGRKSHLSFDEVERTADEVIEPAVKWIRAQEDKWFCWVHLFDPHDPYTPPEPFKTEYRDDPYSGEVAYLDAQLGILFEALEKAGSFEKTIIVVTSDHGEAFGEKEEIRHGFYAYNNTLHIPLFLYYPGVDPKAVGENASHIDIFPTVCDLIGSSLPSHIQGESLLPLVKGKKRKNDLVYFESLSPHLSMDCAPLQGFIKGDMKFIDLPIRELYNIERDYEEEINLAAAAGADVSGFVKDLDALRKKLKGKGTSQDVKGKNADILPLMKSLGYVSGPSTKKKKYGVEDDLKSVQPVIAHLLLAIEEFKSGKAEEAVKKLGNVIRIRPSYTSAYSALAFILYDLDRTDRAVSVLKEGLERIPGNLQLSANLGVILVMAKRYPESIPHLELCTQANRFNPDYANYLGRAYMETGSYGPAEKKFRDALDLDPNFLAALSNLGYLKLISFVKTKDARYHEQAVAYFEKALSLDPSLPSALKGLEAASQYKNKLAPDEKK